MAEKRRKPRRQSGPSRNAVAAKQAEAEAKKADAERAASEARAREVEANAKVREAEARAKAQEVESAARLRREQIAADERKRQSERESKAAFLNQAAVVGGVVTGVVGGKVLAGKVQKDLAASDKARARQARQLARVVDGGPGSANLKAVAKTAKDLNLTLPETRGGRAVRAAGRLGLPYAVGLGVESVVSRVIAGELDERGNPEGAAIARGVSYAGAVAAVAMVGANASNLGVNGADARAVARIEVARIQANAAPEKARPRGARVDPVAKLARESGATLAPNKPKGTPMPDIKERLKGLKKAQLQAVAREAGVRFNSKTTVAGLRDSIAQTMRSPTYDAQARATERGGSRRAMAQSAVGGLGAGQERRINAAIDKVLGGGPAGWSDAAREASAAERAKASKESRTRRAPRSNPALVDHLAKRFDDVFAMSSGRVEHGNAASAEPAKAKSAALAALEKEIKNAKLSKADAHALAQRTGTPITKRASGKAAVETVARRVANLDDHVRKILAIGGRTAAALGPVVLPVLAVTAASTAFSDSSHAAEARGEERTVARGKGATEAAKAVTDLLSFGAGEATQKALDAGKSRGEAVAIGAAKGAINMATFGVADMANEALADKGGVAGVISDTVTRAAGKVGEMLGWSGDSQANGDARHVDKPGGAGAAALQVANGAGYAVAGHTIVKNAKSFGMPRIIKGSAHAMRATGVLIAAHGLAKLVVGTEPQAAPQGKAYLDENAAQRAAEPPKPVAARPVVAAGAQQQRSDGQTEGYTRRTKTGLTVQVKGYRTPDRR